MGNTARCNSNVSGSPVPPTSVVSPEILRGNQARGILFPYLRLFEIDVLALHYALRIFRAVGEFRRVVSTRCGRTEVEDR
jgi:hypothetical protein